MEEIVALFGQLGESLKGATEGLQNVQKSFSSLSSTVQSVSGVLNKTAEALSGIIEALVTAPLQIVSAAVTLGTELLKLPELIAKMFSDMVAQVLSVFTQGFSILGGSISTITGALLGPIQSLAGAVAPFVGALNPSLMQLFNYTLRNLMATIGVGLTPIIQVLTQTVEQLSVALFPAMQALAPIMANLADIMVGILVPYITMLANTFVVLAPVIKFVTDLMLSLADALRVFMTVHYSVVQTLLQSIAGLFGEVNLKDMASQFRQVLQTLVSSFVQFAVYLSKFLNEFGYANNFAQNLLKNLDTLQGKGEHAVAAPTNAGIKGFEQIGKEIAMAAFTAQGQETDPQKEAADFLRDIKKMVEDIQSGKMAEPEWAKSVRSFVEKFDEFVKWAKERFKVLSAPVEQAANNVQHALSRNEVERTGGAAGLLAQILAQIPHP